MAKHIKCGTFYVPSQELLKIVTTHGSDICTLTYIGGETVVGAILLANAAAGTALEDSMYITLNKCIQAGPDAAGSIVDSLAIFTTVT